MAEPSSKIDKARDPDSNPTAQAPPNDWQPSLETPTDTVPHADLDVDLGLVSAPPTDDSPTVITKALRSSPEDVPNGTLRGRKLAHFELIAPIGVGGMAAVIKARDLQLDRAVALKILPPEMAVDPENIRRFHNEARAAAKLDHENIARVFYCGEDQKLHFIAFEFVQGENLRAILERRGRLPVGEALHYLLQVATGLAHAAARGVVHRDIKPSNIIITPDGRAKLVDMGLARSLHPHDDKGLTQSGVTLGTFDYISPEQAMEPRDADVRSDIYSLGCTFYHMLTGQPPVPEGTAARKLHHHQNEAPLDPRQLNPAIPDEVAAILSRMMAKNPRERYQRPEQLVQHLLRVAQKLEGAETPDGVLYVDAPLPSPPASRPLLLAALAIAAVVALVLLADQASAPSRHSGSARPRVAPDARDVRKSPEEAPPIKVGAGEPAASKDEHPAPATTRADLYTHDATKTAADLIKFLKGAPPEVEVVLKDDLDLSAAAAGDSAQAALTFAGRSVTLRAAEGKPRPTIRLTYNGEKNADPWTALRFDTPRVTLKGLRLVLNAAGSIAMTGVHLRRAGEHVVDDCQFIQRYPRYDDRRVCSLLIEPGVSGSSTRASRVTVEACAFVGEEGVDPAAVEPPGQALALRKIARGGHEAITRRGPSVVRVAQCVFGPHQTIVRLEGESRPAEQDVELRHCSAMLTDGSAVIHAVDRAGARVSVSYSLFSRPAPAADAPGSPLSARSVLVRQDNAPGVPLQYIGLDNRYHNLDGYWAHPSQDLIAAEDAREFLALLAREKGSQDAQSRELEQAPWAKSDPLASLQGLQLAAAFRVRPQAPELRLPGLDSGLVGAEVCDGVSYTEGLPNLDDKPPPAVRKEKVVDPAIRESDNGVFKTLGQALDEAAGGDVVLVRHNGPLLVRPVTLEKASADVTVRPAPGYKPVLVLDTAEREAALFRIHDGRLKLEGLELRLSPGSREFDTQSVAAILGNGSCAFEGCVVTLADDADGMLAVVSLVDPSGLMRKGGKPVPGGPAPEVTFDRCFVRGKGELFWCRSSRPFRLEVAQTLAALHGSLLHLEAGKPDEGGVMTGDRPRSSVELRQSTAVLTGHLIRVRAAGKDLKGLVPLVCQSNGCLFASLGGKSLVHLAGVEASEAVLRDRLAWQGATNAYNFMELIDQQPGAAEMMRPPPFDRDKWKSFTGETDGKFVDMIKFPDPVESSSLSSARAAQFMAADLKEYGVGLDQLPLRARDR